MFWLFLVCIVYFYFHWQYFRLVKKMTAASCPRHGMILSGFVLNYVFFAFCGYMEFPLIVNWIFFAFLLMAETVLYNKGDVRTALFCTLLGIICGLSATILCRSLVSILINQPLQRFDNHPASADNLKAVPVCLGFLLGAAWLQCISIKTVIQRIRLIVKYPKHQTFLFEIMLGMFVYLFINLLLYSTLLNDILLKIWSIKSSLFCICGFYIAARYTTRICQLEEYREKNRVIEKELLKRKKEGELLRRKASMDALTGLYNRQYAEEIIDARLRQRQRFILCFVDLDGLKHVNDQFGHNEGDRYITTVTNEIRGACRSGSDLLFRYGGDEFLVLFMEMREENARERIEMVLSKLCSLSESREFSYPLSFSYGLVNSSDYEDWKSLIQAADQKMYRFKQLKLNRTNGESQTHALDA